MTTTGDLRKFLEQFDADTEVSIIFEFNHCAQIKSFYPMRDFEDEGIPKKDVETRNYPTIVIGVA